MTTDYNQIADAYTVVKNQDRPANYCEEYTFLKVLGDVNGRAVLDLGCGSGYYSRLIKQQGAERVVGIDLSENMIDQAIDIQKSYPLGIEYLARDVASLGQIAQFDVVTAVFLFPYAATVQILTSMVQSIHMNLRPGGRLVALVPNPDLREEDLPVYAKYGARMSATQQLRDSTAIRIILDTPEASVTLINYLWTCKTFEKALTNVGFSGLQWHSTQVSTNGMAKYGHSYWQAYLAKPRVVVLSCQKGY